MYTELEVREKATASSTTRKSKEELPQSWENRNPKKTKRFLAHCQGRNNCIKARGEFLFIRGTIFVIIFNPV